MILAFSAMAAVLSGPVIEARAESDLPDVEVATSGLVTDGMRLPVDLACLFECGPAAVELAGVQMALERVYTDLISAIDEEQAEDDAAAAVGSRAAPPAQHIEARAPASEADRLPDRRF